MLDFCLMVLISSDYINSIFIVNVNINTLTSNDKDIEIIEEIVINTVEEEEDEELIYFVAVHIGF